MNTRSIKAKEDRQTTKLSRLVKSLCNELETRERNYRVREYTYQQVIKSLKAKIYMLENRRMRKAA